MKIKFCQPDVGKFD